MKLNRKKKSQKQESCIAKDVGGKTVVASGSKWAAKGDVRTDDYLIEAKYTDNAFYSFHIDKWHKIRKEALNDHGRLPLMIIDVRESRFIVFGADDFEIVDNFPVNTLKSFHLTSTICGKDEYGNYVYLQKVKLGNTLLCVMLYDDFVKEYGGF